MKYIYIIQSIVPRYFESAEAALSFAFDAHTLNRDADKPEFIARGKIALEREGIAKPHWNDAVQFAPVSRAELL